MGPQKYEYQSDFARKYVGQGAREILLGQLAARFGDLPDSVRHRVEQADLDELQRWAGRVINPDVTLADVFDQDP